jgi:type III secretion system FlhB-like substrate exporter
MDYEVAKKLIEHLKNLDEPINEATLVTESIEDLEERRAIRKGLAKVIAMVYVDLMVPICKDHPDLLPEHSNM